MTRVESFTTRRIVLARRPDGLPAEGDFRLEPLTLPAPADGQLVIESRFISVDPGVRGRLGGRVTYAEPLGLGETIQSANVGVVVASRHPKFGVGDRVAAAYGWQEHALSDGRGVRKIPPGPVPPSTAIGVLGVPGLTAYFGMRDIGKPQPGETVVVTSAAGCVGATAGQIAHIDGARVVGTAGGPAKCRWLKADCGFDAAIDHRSAPDMRAALAGACPDGIDVLFDNIGNAMIDAALPLMRQGGRIVVSGQIADYNAAPGSRSVLTDTSHFIGKRLTMRGLVAFDHYKRFPEAWEALTGWIAGGRLIYKEDIEDGFERLPAAFIGLFTGANFGRKLIRIPE
jgi:hypothetical protein